MGVRYTDEKPAMFAVVGSMESPIQVRRWCNAKARLIRMYAIRELQAPSPPGVSPDSANPHSVQQRREQRVVRDVADPRRDEHRRAASDVGDRGRGLDDPPIRTVHAPAASSGALDCARRIAVMTLSEHRREVFSGC